MCPSISVQFSNFNSYFELLVAFTFAYASLKGFKDYINHVTLRDYKTFYAAKLEEVISAVQTVAGPQASLVFQKTVFEKHEEEITKIEKIIQGFYDGTFLQPMFFLAGLEYLFFLFIGGFQPQLKPLTVYLTVCFVFVFTFAYYVFVVIKLRQHSLRQIPPDNKAWLTSYKVLLVFGILNILFLTVAAYLSAIIRSQEHPWFQDSDHFQDYFFCCGHKQLWEAIGIIMAFAISVIPYVIYFFRDALFISPLEASFKRIKNLTEDKLKSMASVARQQFPIKPDDKNG